jgi:D-alanyl-D-alanine carboxypeptidase/D-alanyl-D-alanine-endopeptidase (penicillin-binding protein 4)
MDGWLTSKFGASDARMVDHSGLGEASRVTVEDMVAVLVGAGKDGPLRPLLKEIPLRDAKGKPVEKPGIEIRAKTGTLNFVSCLAGYSTAPGGRVLAFAILSGDLKRRSALDDDEQDRPAGAGAWNARAKALQQGLIERWTAVYAA